MKKILMFIFILMVISIIACKAAKKETITPETKAAIKKEIAGKKEEITKKVEIPPTETKTTTPPTETKTSVDTTEIDQITKDIDSSSNTLDTTNENDADLSGEIQE